MRNSVIVAHFFPYFAKALMKFTRNEYENLFREFYPALVVVARRFVRKTSIAEDLVMDSFLSLWEKIGTESGGGIDVPEEFNLRAYLVVTLKNKCLDYLYSCQLHQAKHKQIYTRNLRLIDANLHSLNAFNPETLFTNEIRSVVNRQLEQMPDLTREVFEASRFYGRTYKEIADQLGITERRVTYEMTKALTKLKLGLKDYLPLILLLFAVNLL